MQTRRDISRTVEVRGCVIKLIAANRKSYAAWVGTTTDDLQ